MYMRKTHFRQKYILMVHNLILKARNSSKHVYAPFLRKILQRPFKHSLTFQILLNLTVLLQLESKVLFESLFLYEIFLHVSLSMQNVSSS